MCKGWWPKARTISEAAEIAQRSGQKDSGVMPRPRRPGSAFRARGRLPGDKPVDLLIPVGVRCDMGRLSGSSSIATWCESCAVLDLSSTGRVRAVTNR